LANRQDALSAITGLNILIQGKMDELISSLAAGKDARATVVRASCPDSDWLIQFPKFRPLSGMDQGV